MAPEPAAVLDFEGTAVAIHDGDTVASALYRHGVRVFSRSFKYHRPRGLYCLTGDCPSCLVNVDGEPCVRSCITGAVPGQRVKRETGWPSTDRDVFGVFDRLRRLLPVGFYYKTMLRPRWLWPAAEPLVRRLAGRGRVSASTVAERREVRHLHPDLVVIGAGVAGLSAAIAAAEAGSTVVICDEGLPGEKVAPGSTLDRIKELLSRALEMPRITFLERTPAIGIYEGPLVVLDEPSFLHLVHPRRILVATGAVEEHGTFPGNDLPGVWLGRGAARLAGAHGVLPCRRLVLVGGTTEADAHAETLRRAGAEVTVVQGDVLKVRGRRSVRQVVITDGVTTSVYRCEGLVLSRALEPRASLTLQGSGLDVASIGDASIPGRPISDVEREARLAALEELTAVRSPAPLAPRVPGDGIVCLCEDVSMTELEQAWAEGFRSTEILKRYTTATMGPCQGQLCHRHLRAFVASQVDSSGPGSGSTTARPPVRGITLERVSAGVSVEIHQRTALHETHLRLGAEMESAGIWRRPQHYGDVTDEYWAVRTGVSLMDVGTLGKFLVTGVDAVPFLERLYPNNVADLRPGRLRYALLLGEHGYVIDDGIICAPERDQWYITFTSSGATTAESMLRDWAETWGHGVHIVDLTAAWGAVNVAGPRARDLLERVCAEPIDNDAFPYLSHRELLVAGVPCKALRLGFVGELSYELHHPSNRSVELWESLTAAGQDLGVRPHGLDALRVLRLEKGHVIVGQDTDFDTTPRKLNMDWAVKLDKSWFLGKPGVQRSNAHDVQRKLVAVSFAANAPREGAVLRACGREVGYLSSSAWSPVLERGVALGWIERVNGKFPTAVEADDIAGVVVEEPFYDPNGGRLRA